MNIPQVNAGFNIGPFTITNTIVWTWLILGLLSVVFIVLGHGLKVRNISKKQALAESIYGAVKNMVQNTMGPGNEMFVTYFLALFSFLLVSNISGFWGLGIVRQPTADIATPLSMALLTFGLTQFNHVRVNGIKSYLHSFIEPTPIMLPMNLISELANPVSLTFRMFGNLLGGLIIGTLIYGILVSGNAMPIWIGAASAAVAAVLLTGRFKKLMKLEKKKKKMVLGLLALCVLPLIVTVFIHAYFDIFAGVLQAYIFCMLSMIFIS